MGRPQAGVFRITSRGLDVLKLKPSRIDVAYLEKFAEFKEFVYTSPATEAETWNQSDPSASERTPQEVMDDAYQRIRGSLAAELLATMRECSPERFERLVVDLLVKMGYGGSRRDAGQALGRSGDAGIDGIIKEDHLGLDAIYIQAKRWAEANGVGRPAGPAHTKSCLSQELERYSREKSCTDTDVEHMKAYSDFVDAELESVLRCEESRLLRLIFDC